MNKLIAATLMMMLLAGLLAWQSHRWTMVSDCRASGGVWDGTSSKCRLVPARIFIERELL
ncbi:MAG: hypothetical protein CMB79_21415 [Filomicrobium sp.]|nr:hypothetical protein [Filomicrobium sp.]